jgi:hypothetical protein
MQCQRLRSIKHSGGIRIFESWKSEIIHNYVPAETCNFGLDVSVVLSLKTDMLNMTAETLNFRLFKFVQEVRD